MTSDELNKLKKRLSGAYLTAVVGKANLGLQESNKDLDDEGIDYIVKMPRCGTGGQIHIQLKGVSVDSASMYEDCEDSIKYNLQDSYEKVTPPAYLVVVVLPSESDITNWCVIEEDHLRISKCAYFIELPQRTGKISISKQNVFNHESLIKLFPSSEKKEDMF